MVELPKDTAMLLSYVNTKLRDEYDSLDAMCEDLGIDKEDIEVKLNSAGYEYNSQMNKFW